MDANTEDSCELSDRELGTKAVDLIFCFCLPMFNGTGAGAEPAMLIFSRVGFSHMTWRR